MKKALCCALLALSFFAAGSAPRAVAALTAAPAGDTLEATLYFRFGETPYLGAQRAELDLRRDEMVASVLVSLLLEGPDASHAALTGLFPQGTALISVSGDGSTAYVTLSSDFLGRPDGAPADWEASAAWQEEAALRRRMALQSVVMTLTEGARYQRVQFFVADSDDDMPRRIELCRLDTQETDASLVLGACGRDETLLLTPRRALELALEAWRVKDWASLYALLYDDAGLPSLSAFEQEMAQTDVTLVSSELSGGSVDLSGRTATLVLDAEVRSAQGGDAQIVRESVPVRRVDDNWALALSTLRDLMVRD